MPGLNLLTEAESISPGGGVAGLSTEVIVSASGVGVAVDCTVSVPAESGVDVTEGPGQHNPQPDKNTNNAGKSHSKDRRGEGK